VTRVCTFALADRLLGIDADGVREIVVLRELTPVAGAPAEVRGLLNLRGQIVSCLELGVVLGLAPAMAPNPRAIVVEYDDELVGLVVDRVTDVLELDPAAIEAIPPTVPRAMAGILRGACQRPGALLLLLDLDRILATDDRAP
jgi:purine-binding chemotaxis protein CheW